MKTLIRTRYGPLVTLWLFTALCAHAVAIVSAEYFFDSDPGRGNGTAIWISPDSTVNFTVTPNLSSLTIGQHILYVRTLDDSGHWSAPVLKSIQIRSEVTTASAPVMYGGEYAFDNDPGVGNATPFWGSFRLDDTLSILPSLYGMSTGQHTLFLRVKDNNGRWSTTLSRPFQLRPDVSAGFGSPSIQSVEYYFDSYPESGYPGAAMGHYATLDTIDVALVTSNLSVGQHTLYLQVVDGNGRRSLARSRPFQVRATPTTVDTPRIIAAEGYWDTDPGFGNGVFIPVTGVHDSVNIIASQSLYSLTPGQHKWNVRVRDSHNQWSPVVSKPYQIRSDVVPTTVSNITRLEYAIDSDPGVGSGTTINVTPATSVTASIQQYLLNYTGGLHNVYFRARDALGKWGITKTFQFTVSGNHPPRVVTPIPDVTLNENFGSYTLPSLDTYFSDLDTPGDHLTYLPTVVGNSAFCAITGNSLTLLSYTNRSGMMSITVTATDTGLASVTTTFNVNVIPGADAPMAPAVSIFNNYPDVELQWSPVTTSVHNNPVAVSSYIVYYRSATNYPWEYHGYVDTDGSALYHYFHRRVMQRSQSMFYKVQALTGVTDSMIEVLQDAARETQSMPVTEGVLHRRIEEARALPRKVQPKDEVR